jgi:hypothetical protein
MDEPIRAVKRAVLRYTGEGVTLAATAWEHTYGPDATAVCLQPPERSHRTPAPDVHCTCGFHALRERRVAKVAIFPYVWLDVELLGRVIVHERGYRAGRQRVLAVLAGSACRIAPPCPLPPATIVLDPLKDVFGIRDGPPEEGNPLRLVPWCSRHAPGQAEWVGSPFPALNPSDLAGMLGTEVRWG